MYTNIVMVGMPGSGKSTVGRLLAKRLRMSFLDTDLTIEQREGRRLQEIIDAEGNDRFLEIEQEVLLGVDVTNTVISPGGSAVYSDAAMAYLKKSSLVIYLDIPFDELLPRLHNLSTRGIVMKNGYSIQELYDERNPLFRKYADLIIPCGGGQTKEECLKKVLLALKTQKK
ncbi:MAG: shikimate kinase [Clostridia bacterium]|nr:shikimate kinase [Clostridia bacterium]